MAQPRKLDKYEAASALAPLVWPMLEDKAIVHGPRGGNPVTSGVHISYSGGSVFLDTDQYELFRVEVLQYFLENYYLKPILTVLTQSSLDQLIRDKVLEVFAEE